MSRNCLPQCQRVQARSQELWDGVSRHHAASRRLVLVGDLNTTNSPMQETQVDLSATLASAIPASIPVLQMAEAVSTVPASSSEIRAAQNHAQVVVPASFNSPSSGGRIPLHNSFEALRRNDEDVPMDGHEVFFGDESDTESLRDSDRGDGEVVEEAIPMEARPRIVNIGLEALDGVDLSEEFHRRPTHDDVCAIHSEGCIQGRNARCSGRDHRTEAPTQRGEGGKRMEVVLLDSLVVAFQASARRWCLQKQVGRQVKSICIRRVFVPFGRKQKVVRSR